MKCNQLCVRLQLLPTSTPCSWLGFYPFSLDHHWLKRGLSVYGGYELKILVQLQSFFSHVSNISLTLPSDLSSIYSSLSFVFYLLTHF